MMKAKRSRIPVIVSKDMYWGNNTFVNVSTVAASSNDSMVGKMDTKYPSMPATAICECQGAGADVSTGFFSASPVGVSFFLLMMGASAAVLCAMIVEFVPMFAGFDV
jgi:hypothetical protein